MKISEGAYAFWQGIFVRLNEKTSITGYALVIAGLFEPQYQSDFVKAAAAISLAAGIALFFIRDPWVKSWLTKPATERKPPQVPPSNQR